VTDGITSQRASNIYTNFFMVRAKHEGVQKEMTLGWTKQRTGKALESMKGDAGKNWIKNTGV
jgi:hypothetical protein